MKVQLLPLQQKNPVYPDFLFIFVFMEYRTFENKVVDTNKIDHQHLSNIYWFNKILNRMNPPSIITNRINEEFGGEILP